MEPAGNARRRSEVALLEGDRRALARALSQVEDEAPEVPALLASVYPFTGRAHIVGVTGAPGTGKSTLVNALARAYRTSGETVGIIAVDPTSPFSGGALLGDRVRMRDLAGDPGVFIRSMATRGSLGGLARTTHEALQLLDAAGFSRILVETVGVGQAEVDIASAAHTTIVIEMPGFGDELQTMKAGVLEIADLLVVNKADREGADQAAVALQAMQGLVVAADPQPDGLWVPPIVKTVATTSEGVEALRLGIEAHRAHQHRTGSHSAREVARATSILTEILSQQMRAALIDRLPDGQLARLGHAIARRELDPYSAARTILSEHPIA